MQLLLIVNESASSVTPRVRVLVGRALSADHHLRVTETNRRGHAAWLAQGAAAEGVEVVVVLGGDGTVNEAANGLVGSSSALAVLPGGSTNVYARTIGMVNDPVRAAHQLSASLHPSAIRPVSLGVVNGRYFLFHVGFGFDAAVVAQVERWGGLKRHAGPLVFLWAAAGTWLRRYDRSRPRLTVKTAEGLAEDGMLAICLKTDPYTFLGNRPLTLVPGTDLDSTLSVVNLRLLNLRVLLGSVGAALTQRPPATGRRSHVGSHRDLESLTVIGHGPLPYQVDGDYLGEGQLFELRCQPDALRLVVPGPWPGDPPIEPAQKAAGM